MADKTYTFTITAHVTGDDDKEMFDSQVVYKNMRYEDVVLVEGAIIKMLEGLNQYAEQKTKGKN